MTDITLHDMSAEEIADALQRTGLHILFAVQPKGAASIQAAHGDPDSFILMHFPEAAEHEQWQGIRMTGGSRDERQQRYWGMLASLQQSGMGKPYEPNGKPVHFDQDIRVVEGDGFLERRTFLRRS